MPSNKKMLRSLRGKRESPEYRACSRKISYSTSEEAEQQLQFLQRTHFNYSDQEVYECRFCHQYHLGRKQAN